MMTRISAYAKFFPMQSRVPWLNGLKTALLSLAYLDSYSGWVAGSQRWGRNESGSMKFSGLRKVAH